MHNKCQKHIAFLVFLYILIYMVRFGFALSSYLQCLTALLLFADLHFYRNIGVGDTPFPRSLLQQIASGTALIPRFFMYGSKKMIDSNVYNLFFKYEATYLMCKKMMGISNHSQPKMA